MKAPTGAPLPRPPAHPHPVSSSPIPPPLPHSSFRLAYIPLLPSAAALALKNPPRSVPKPHARGPPREAWGEGQQHQQQPPHPPLRSSPS